MMEGWGGVEKLLDLYTYDYQIEEDEVGGR
jgi:hypothetical protein